MPIYQFPQSEPNFIESHRLNLEAGRTKVLECYGRTFVCVRAAGGFMMSFNNGKLFDCRNGVEWSLGEDERYNLLKFKSGLAQTVDVLTGNFFYHENVVTPVSSVAPTLVKSGPQVALAAGASWEFVGLGPSEDGYGYRKHFIVTNIDGDSDLDLLTADDKLIGTIFARQANVFETSATLKLKNNSAGPMSPRVMEIFYLV